MAPLHKTTLENHTALFALLEQVPAGLDFPGGAACLLWRQGTMDWSGVEPLCQRLHLDSTAVSQVIEYTQAKPYSQPPIAGMGWPFYIRASDSGDRVELRV